MSVESYLSEKYGLTKEQADEVIDLLTNPDRTEDFVSALSNTIEDLIEKEDIAETQIQHNDLDKPMTTEEVSERINSLRRLSLILTETETI